MEATDKHDAYQKANSMRESLDWDTTDDDYEYPDIEEVT
jgi:hypothetical protein